MWPLCIFCWMMRFSAPSKKWAQDVNADCINICNAVFLMILNAVFSNIVFMFFYCTRVGVNSCDGGKTLAAKPYPKRQVYYG